jgi:dTMP kinase
MCCRDPGGTPLGDSLRNLLLERGPAPISVRAEMLLYMASRAELIEKVIAPALEAGLVVISDRYLLSNIVYQASAGGLLEEEIALVGTVATSGLLPDLTLILDIAPAAARARTGLPRDRVEDRPLFYHERVRAGFLAAVAAAGEAGSAAAGCPFYPAPVAVIDAAADADTVFAHIQREVERILALAALPDDSQEHPAASDPERG